jgi:hypothetical protein
MIYFFILDHFHHHHLATICRPLLDEGLSHVFPHFSILCQSAPAVSQE